MISKELLSEVLGKKISHVEYCEIEGIKYNGMFAINIYKLAHKCKEKAREWGYIVLTGFNDDIIDDDGLIALDALTVDRYRAKIIKIDEKHYPHSLKTVAFIGGENISEVDFKACQWILKNKGK